MVALYLFLLKSPILRKVFINTNNYPQNRSPYKKTYKKTILNILLNNHITKQLNNTLWIIYYSYSIWLLYNYFIEVPLFAERFY